MVYFVCSPSISTEVKKINGCDTKGCNVLSSSLNLTRSEIMLVVWSGLSLKADLGSVLVVLDNEPSSGAAQILASLRDRITTTPSIMMNMMTIMIAIY